MTETNKPSTIGDRIRDAGDKIVPSVSVKDGRFLVGNKVMQFLFQPPGTESTQEDVRFSAERDQLQSRIRDLEDELRRDRSIPELLANPVWRERLAEMLEEDPENVGVLFFDVTNFKRANNILGQSKGDALLHEIALNVLGSARESDASTLMGADDDVGRLGGDEFAVLLDLSPRDEGVEIDAEQRLLAARSRFCVNLEEIHENRPELRARYKLDIAVGAANGQQGYTAEQLISHAEVDMRRHKNQQHQALGSYRS